MEWIQQADPTHETSVGHKRRGVHSIMAHTSPLLLIQYISRLVNCFFRPSVFLTTGGLVVARNGMDPGLFALKSSKFKNFISAWHQKIGVCEFEYF